MTLCFSTTLAAISSAGHGSGRWWLGQRNASGQPTEVETAVIAARARATQAAPAGNQTSGLYQTLLWSLFLSRVGTLLQPN